MLVIVTVDIVVIDSVSITFLFLSLLLLHLQLEIAWWRWLWWWYTTFAIAIDAIDSFPIESLVGHLPTFTWSACVWVHWSYQYCVYVWRVFSILNPVFKSSTNRQCAYTSHVMFSFLSLSNQHKHINIHPHLDDLCRSYQFFLACCSFLSLDSPFFFLLTTINFTTKY